jgi:hypothetical protein
MAMFLPTRLNAKTGASLVKFRRVIKEEFAPARVQQDRVALSDGSDARLLDALLDVSHRDDLTKFHCSVQKANHVD